SASCSGVSSGLAPLALSLFSSAIVSPLRPSRRLEGGAALPADAALVLALVVLVLGAPRGDALAAPERHVRHVHRAFLLQDAPARIALGRLGVPLDHVDPLDHHPVLLGQQAQHAAALRLLLTGDDDDLIALANVHDLQNLRRERDDLHEALGAQLASHRPEDAGSDRLVVLVDQHRRVRVEPDVRAVLARDLFLGPDDDRLGDLALLDLRVGNGLLDRDDDDVADGGVLPLGAAEHADAHDLLGARVVGDVERGGGLDHGLSLLRTLDELFDAPPLVARQRAALDDLHAIAGLGLVLLVVRLVLRAVGQVLAVLAVSHPARDQDDARLVHLVAGDDADHAAL